MPLILNSLNPVHWAIAGALIAAVTLCLLFVANRRLGISSGLEDICSLVLDQPFFRRIFVIGMIGAATVYGIVMLVFSSTVLKA